MEIVNHDCSVKLRFYINYVIRVDNTHFMVIVKVMHFLFYMQKKVKEN